MNYSRLIKWIKAVVTSSLIIVLPVASLLSTACKDDPIGPVLTDQDENDNDDKNGAGD